MEVTRPFKFFKEFYQFGSVYLNYEVNIVNIPSTMLLKSVIEVEVSPTPQNFPHLPWASCHCRVQASLPILYGKCDDAWTGCHTVHYLMYNLSRQIQMECSQSEFHYHFEHLQKENDFSYKMISLKNLKQKYRTMKD